MSFCLFVIDIQHGFISENTKHVIQRIKSLLDQNIFEYVIFTRFINTLDSPYVKYLNWHGLISEIEQKIVTELEGFANKVFDKNIYTACNVETLRFLQERNIKTIFICGIDTEGCVLKTAVDFFEANVRSYVLEYYSASNGGDNCQKAAILVLSQLIGINHIITGSININNVKSLLEIKN